MKITNKNINVPNALSVLRILLIIPFVILYTRGEFVWAVVCLVLSGLSDLFDGMIARRFHQQTEVGQMLDPIADKLTQGTVAICLPAATGSSTTGMPRALARLPARSMASRSPMAPRLHTRAWTPATASSTSRTSWDMVGEPPAARMMLAQSLTVTKLVMHCTRGARARTERRRAAKLSCSISAPHRLSSSSIRSSTLARLSSRSTAQPIRPPTTEAGR